MKKTLAYLALIASFYLGAQEHPNLILTQAGVDEIRANLGKIPFFDAHLAEVKAEVDAEIEKGIFVPIPKDMAGGYTHERHKQNFFILQRLGHYIKFYRRQICGLCQSGVNGVCGHLQRFTDTSSAEVICSRETLLAMFE